MSKVFIVVKGGCVSYVSSDNLELDVEVLYLDDINDETTDSEVFIEGVAKLKEAKALTRLW